MQWSASPERCDAEKDLNEVTCDAGQGEPGLEETFLIEHFIYYLYSHNNAVQ